LKRYAQAAEPLPLRRRHRHRADGVRGVRGPECPVAPRSPPARFQSHSAARLRFDWSSSVTWRLSRHTSPGFWPKRKCSVALAELAQRDELEAYRSRLRQTAISDGPGIPKNTRARVGWPSRTQRAAPPAESTRTVSGVCAGAGVKAASSAATRAKSQAFPSSHRRLHTDFTPTNSMPSPVPRLREYLFSRGSFQCSWAPRLARRCVAVAWSGS